FFAEAEQDPTTARLNLAKRRLDYANQEWGWYLVDLMLGAIDDDQFLKEYALRDLGDDETPAERMCETYFYLGKLRQLEGDFTTAEVYFRMALSAHVPFFLEHRYAGLELHRTALARDASTQPSLPSFFASKGVSVAWLAAAWLTLSADSLEWLVPVELAWHQPIVSAASHCGVRAATPVYVPAGDRAAWQLLSLWQQHPLAKYYGCFSLHHYALEQLHCE